MKTYPKNILNLTLKKEWFDMILAGIKNNEYREIKPYWTKRLEGKEYDGVKFVNGYGNHRPYMVLWLTCISKEIGNSNWGAPDYPVYSLALGGIVETGNIDDETDITDLPWMASYPIY